MFATSTLTSRTVVGAVALRRGTRKQSTKTTETTTTATTATIRRRDVIVGQGGASVVSQRRHHQMTLASRQSSSSSSSSSSSMTSMTCRAFGDAGEGSLLDELDADERCPVPKDQRPASQLREIQESILLGWGGLELKGYLLRLGLLGSFFYFVIAYPIAAYSYNPETQPVEAVICALVGSLTATASFALIIYNNWNYVRNRLLSATVEYEETGWYDGQVYVKDPEMLARDRLLGTYTVRPIVERLRKTLLACGAGVFVSLAALNTIDAPEYGVERQQYESGGAGFYMETSRTKYEPPQTAEEEEEEEKEELARYEAAMERYQRDNAEAAAETTE